MSTYSAQYLFRVFFIVMGRIGLVFINKNKHAPHPHTTYDKGIEREREGDRKRQREWGSERERGEEREEEKESARETERGKKLEKKREWRRRWRQ